MLKQHLPESQAEGLLLVWDKQLEQLGTEIAVQRSIYVRRLAEVCVPLYARIARGRETISLHYQSSVFGRDAQETLPEQATPELVRQYGEKMRQSRASDLQLGHTGSGAHRDDLFLAIDGKPAKEFGSQGQKKSLALSLKLAQAEIYSKRRKESPVVLLDDVMGELDEARQAVVSTIVREMQVFVTTCHPESCAFPKNGTAFSVERRQTHGRAVLTTGNCVKFSFPQTVENCVETLFEAVQKQGSGRFLRKFVRFRVRSASCFT